MEAAAIMIAGLAGMVLFWSCVGIAIIVIWILSLIDVIKNEFENPNNKIIWIMFLLIVPPIGTIFYLIIGKNQKVKKMPVNKIAPAYTKTENKPDPEAEKTCKACGEEMKIRKKQTGPDAGKSFWVCRAFPNCNSFEEISFQEAEKWF